MTNISSSFYWSSRFFGPSLFVFSVFRLKLLIVMAEIEPRRAELALPLVRRGVDGPGDESVEDSAGGEDICESNGEYVPKEP